MKGKNKKVYVGMSGGVDSSLSAALLKEQGYDVTGVFIRVWQIPKDLPRALSRGDSDKPFDYAQGNRKLFSGACDWKEERRDAMRVAAELDIPFKTYDFQDEYKKEVVDYMIREYREGRTPNPDVMCNRYIKFGSFLKKAVGDGADFIATGHYARKKRIQDSRFKIQGHQLLKGKDNNKDQSYFLWTLTQDDLEKTIFPIGELDKPKVREEAKRFKLHNAEKKDSQGICFLGKIDVKEFLQHFIESKDGEVLNENGEVIGVHDGAMFLTLGQRHGFTIIKKTPEDKPYYIVGKNVDKNTITVSNELKVEEFQSTKKEVEIKNVNWVHLDVRRLSRKKYKARLRYRQDLRECVVEERGEKTFVIFDELQENVTPGQSLVLYDGEICLGGGVIK
jgi:tRNA-uridine 2-sulfurtransferase